MQKALRNQFTHLREWAREDLFAAIFLFDVQPIGMAGGQLIGRGRRSRARTRVALDGPALAAGVVRSEPPPRRQASPIQKYPKPRLVVNANIAQRLAMLRLAHRLSRRIEVLQQ